MVLCDCDESSKKKKCERNIGDMCFYCEENEVEDKKDCWIRCKGPCNRVFHRKCMSLFRGSTSIRNSSKKTWQCPDCKEKKYKCFICMKDMGTDGLNHGLNGLLQHNDCMDTNPGFCLECGKHKNKHNNKINIGIPCIRCGGSMHKSCAKRFQEFFPVVLNRGSQIDGVVCRHHGNDPDLPDEELWHEFEAWTSFFIKFKNECLNRGHKDLAMFVRTLSAAAVFMLKQEREDKRFKAMAQFIAKQGVDKSDFTVEEMQHTVDEICCRYSDLCEGINSRKEWDLFKEFSYVHHEAWKEEDRLRKELKEEQEGVEESKTEDNTEEEEEEIEPPKKRSKHRRWSLQKTISAYQIPSRPEYNIKRDPFPVNYTKIRSPNWSSSGFIKQFPDECCGCEANEDGIGCLDNCMNRQTNFECSKQSCKLLKEGQCTNCRIRKGVQSKCRIAKAGAKGFGLYAVEHIEDGKPIMEYAGEVLNEKQRDARLEEALRTNQRHFYMLEVEVSPSFTLDALNVGNQTRFINHSCTPNCVAEKWFVDGYPRILIVALRDIKKDEEITFDYQFSFFNGQSSKCYCESEDCSGIMGQGSRGTKNSKKKQISKVRPLWTMPEDDIPGIHSMLWHAQRFFRDREFMGLQPGGVSPEALDEDDPDKNRIRKKGRRIMLTGFDQNDPKTTTAQDSANNWKERLLKKFNERIKQEEEQEDDDEQNTQENVNNNSTPITTDNQDQEEVSTLTNTQPITTIDKNDNHEENMDIDENSEGNNYNNLPNSKSLSESDNEEDYSEFWKNNENGNEEWENYQKRMSNHKWRNNLPAYSRCSIPAMRKFLVDQIKETIKRVKELKEQFPDDKKIQEFQLRYLPVLCKRIIDEGTGISHSHDISDHKCARCKAYGDTICCDQCPRVFHPSCVSLMHNSELEKLADKGWICPHCVSENREERRNIIEKRKQQRQNEREE
eukprot:TRINITY_DN13_c10_g1_i1.p1 TRINITY_DN13_c10_g1~~TRINITY_DN13_c10_g1_i1.p1  ORF type:complete len:949 (-),score=249.90 TRINITY_DN13_c10_g1_i1:284-3130(-)